MRVKRSERLVEMTADFLKQPHQVFPLDYFTEKFEAAKSSISEDLSIIKAVFIEQQLGDIITFSGARGGVQFVPTIAREQIKKYMEQLQQVLHESERLLPGGYIYTSDILSEPLWLQKIGQLIASKYSRDTIDAILTIATKGIPIAQAVAEALDVPFVIVRKTSKVTEGSTVGINYVPYSSAEDMRRMELSTRSLSPGSKVLIIDDFLRGGGTLQGLSMIAEAFKCEIVDRVVFIENLKTEKTIDMNYHSLFKIQYVDDEHKKIQVTPSNLL